MIKDYLEFFKNEIETIDHEDFKGEAFKEIIFRRDYIPFYKSAEADEFIEFLEDFCWDVEEVSGGFIFTLEHDYIVVIINFEEWLEDM